MPHPLSIPDSSTNVRHWAPCPFSCTRKPDGLGSIWIHLVGELDLATSPLFQQALEKAQDDASIVSIDLQELTFIDSAGLAIIVRAAARAAVTRARLILVGATGQVARLFALTGLPATVEVVEFGPPQAFLGSNGRPTEEAEQGQAGIGSR